MATPLIQSLGRLYTTSQEEQQSLRKLAQESGRGQVPTSPMEAAALGATEDQAKMAGTDVTRLAAAEQAAEPLVAEEKELGTALRRRQVRKKATAEEQLAQERSDRIAQLEGLGERVQQIADQMFTEENQDRITELSLDESRTRRLSSESMDALNRLVDGTASAKDIHDLNISLGRTANNALTFSELKSYFLTGASQVAGAISEATQDNILVGDLTPEQVQELGFTDVNEVADLLDVDTSDLQNMTIGNLRDQVLDIQVSQYARTQELQGRMVNPNLSYGERMEARRLLREVGGVGTRGAEQQMREVQKDIDEARIVEFAGQEFTVEELLADDNISSMVKRYLENPNSDFAKNLRQDEPLFSSYIEDNKDALDGLVAGVEAGFQEFEEIQEHNRNIGRLPDGSAVSDEILQDLVPGFNQLQYERLSEPPVLQYLKSNIPPQYRNTINTALTSLHSIAPNLAQELAGTDTNTLHRYAAIGETEWTNYANALAQKEYIQNMEPHAAEEFLLKGQRDQYEEAISQARAAQAYGLDTGIDMDFLNTIDADGDGKVDDPAQLKNLVLQDYLPQGRNLQEVLTRRKAVPTSPPPISTTDTLFEKVKGYYSDGRITTPELREITNNPEISYADMDRLSGNIETTFLDDLKQEKARSEALEHWRATIGGTPSDFDPLINKVGKDALSDEEYTKLVNTNKTYSAMLKQVEQGQIPRPVAEAFRKMKSKIFDAWSDEAAYRAGIGEREGDRIRREAATAQATKAAKKATESVVDKILRWSPW